MFSIAGIDDLIPSWFDGKMKFNAHLKFGISFFGVLCLYIYDWLMESFNDAEKLLNENMTRLSASKNAMNIGCLR